MDANKTILLTFDLEEFDLPLEYGNSLTFRDQMGITSQGMQRLNDLLNRNHIRATFFITSAYAQANPEVVKGISQVHEVASHSHSHSFFDQGDYLKSKQILEDICQVNITGFRMPRLAGVDYETLKRSGFLYDSSLNPAYIPTRYNNYSEPRTIFKEPVSGLTILPLSVSPLFRFPLFWLSFKNIPFACYKYLSRKVINKDKYLLLCFHPWEFADIGSFNIPWLIKRESGEVLLAKFEKLIVFLKGLGEFMTISDYLETVKKNH